MPRAGLLDFQNWNGTVAEIENYKTEPWILKGAQILNLAFEIDDLSADHLIPPALHPTIPAYASFNVTIFPESPVGRFATAEVKVCGRAGVRPRAFPLRAVIDSQDAARELARRWGFPVSPGKITVDLRHDRVTAEVGIGNSVAMKCELLDRETISGGDIQYIASMHLARSLQDDKLVLVQVDPEYVFSKAERGRPILSFDPAAWNTGGHVKVINPISATYTVCDVTLPKIRYICDPGKPAYFGTTKVAA